MTPVPHPRSLLYVPATRPGWVAKAWAAGADAAVLDLEDAVPGDRKDEGRAAAAEALARHAAEPAEGAGQLWVRVDTDDTEADLRAVVGRGLTGLLVPKAEPESLSAVAELLASLEADAGLPERHTRVTAVVETARGLQRLEEVAWSPRVTRLALGEADLAGELGIIPDEWRTELYPARFALVLASAAAGLARPVGPVHTALDDAEGLAETCAEQLRQGFRARTAIHPSQVAIINATFTPSTDEVSAAREVIAAYEAGLAAGHGAVRGPGGALLDRATVRQAHDTLSRADTPAP